jgi:hypothetical protein
MWISGSEDVSFSGELIAAPKPRALHLDRAYGRVTAIGLWALLELGAMFRIEWLIGAATRKGSSYWPLRQNIFFPFKQLEADSGCLYHPDGPHRNKLQMAPRERIARAAAY